MTSLTMHSLHASGTPISAKCNTCSFVMDANVLGSFVAYSSVGLPSRKLLFSGAPRPAMDLVVWANSAEVGIDALVHFRALPAAAATSFSPFLSVGAAAVADRVWNALKSPAVAARRRDEARPTGRIPTKRL